MKKIKYCAFVLLVLILSCSEDSKVRSAVKIFSGTWNWTYTANCGLGPQNETGDIVITESSVNDGELYVVFPFGAFEASASGDPNPFFYFSYTDGNGVDTNVNAMLNDDGVLDITATQSDDSPLFYCAFLGDAVKQ